MNIQFHPANERGHIQFDWLDTYHSFSFGEYYNPDKMGFGKLRVMNDDIVQGGKGFGMHSHDNMEIVTIPLLGELAHRDTLGSGSVIKPGEIQLMSAGSGISHSEFNHSQTEQVNLLQIWILPDKKNKQPSYEQKFFDESGRRDQFQLLVSPDGRNGSLPMNQQAFFSMIEMSSTSTQTYQPFLKNTAIYLFVIDGRVNVGEHRVSRRDALAISNADKVEMNAVDASRVLMIETVF